LAEPTIEKDKKIRGQAPYRKINRGGRLVPFVYVGIALYTTFALGPAEAAENFAGQLIMKDEFEPLFQAVNDTYSGSFQAFDCRDRITDSSPGISVEDAQLLNDILK